MKKQKIKVNGIRYKYIITEENTISVEGIVPYKTYQIIKERLIKQGKYQEKKSETIKVEHDEEFLKKRFEKWSNVELKLQMEDYKDGKILNPDEEEFRDQVKAELKRRGIIND